MRSSEPTPFAPLAGASAAPTFRGFGSPVAKEPIAVDPQAVAFEAGRAEGRREGRAEVGVLAADVARAVAQIGAWREELRSRYSGTLLELALAIARRIAGEALDADPARWTAIVEAAMRGLVDREQVTVRVPPRLVATLRAAVPALVAGDAAAQVRIVEDTTVGERGCRVESRSGDVECGLDAQVAAIAEALGAERA
jgi:flagellar assembly protein FliH